MIWYGLFFIAPMLSLAPALAAWAVVPFSETLVLADINAGLLYILAMTSIGVYGLGRFGVFYASLLSRLGTVRAWSRDPDKQPPPGVIRVPSEQELCRLPVVVLCVAISAMQEVLRRIAPLLAPGPDADAALSKLDDLEGITADAILDELLAIQRV